MIDSQKLVTIAIPFFNENNYIEQAIKSVINQTYENWELILINDGVDMKCIEIAETYAVNDNRIRFINDGKNKGLATRLNETITMANGEYYARMDADDIMCIERIAEQVQFLNEYPDVDVVGSSAMIIDSKNQIVGSSDMSGTQDSFIHPSIMGRTKWFRINPYAEWCRRCQDRELWLRTSGNSNFYNIQKPLLYYREAGTITINKYLGSQMANLEIFKHYKEYGKNFVWYIKSNFRCYLSVFIYYIFSKIGKIDYLVNKRKRKSIPISLQLRDTDISIAIN